MTQIDTNEPTVMRVVDRALEVLPVARAWDANQRTKAFAAAETKDGALKPREHAEVLTTQSGVFAVTLRMPDGTTVPLTSVTLTVEPGKVGVVSVAVRAGQRLEPVVEVR